MKNYDGLFHSTYTEQLPFGPAIVRGAYDEGYDWSYNHIWKRGYSGDPHKYREVWIDGEYDSDKVIVPMNRLEFEDHIRARDWKRPFPSEETIVFMRALENGSPRPYGAHGERDDAGLFDTSNLSSDAWMALWDGAYDGYIDAVHECADGLRVEAKERDE